MSKETSSGQATKCICGNTFAFMEQHWPHCTMNPDNLTGAARKSVETKFTKSELAHIAQHGGQVHDQPVGKRKKRKIKP